MVSSDDLMYAVAEITLSNNPIVKGTKMAVRIQLYQEFMDGLCIWEMFEASLLISQGDIELIASVEDSAMANF